MTTRQIGAKYGVSKTEVVRWMKRHGIERRAANNGLLYRGVTSPTSDELRHLVHVEHLSYKAIAERYGVDHTAIPYWLSKHDIPKPTVWETRRRGAQPKPFDADDIRRRYASGESTRMIAEHYGVSPTPLRKFMRESGIQLKADGWDGGKRYDCLDGHVARSIYEQRVDDWLHAHGLAHECEPAYPWDRRYRADFKVGDTYIEVWGVTENPAYEARKAVKVRKCKENDLPLISIHPWQFGRGRRWWASLQSLVSNPPHGLDE